MEFFTPRKRQGDADVQNRREQIAGEIAPGSCEQPETLSLPRVEAPADIIRPHDVDPYYGQHLRVMRGIYAHHGIGVGGGMVIHYPGSSTGCSASSESPPSESLRLDSLEEFAGGADIEIIPHPGRRYSPEEAVQRARNALLRADKNPDDEDYRYDVLFNNCEHFVNWCIEGEKKSSQVRTAATVGGIAALAAVAMIIAKKIGSRARVPRPPFPLPPRI